jgi:o-succinylbenzoate---CoA ligase
VPELVALDLAAGPDFVGALQAVWDDGHAVAPLDPRLPKAAREAVLAALRPAKVWAADGELHALAGGLPVEDGDAIVIATSGSSGEPKGVVLTHDALLASARATSERLGIDPRRHTWLSCLPLAHVGGLSVITRALLTDTELLVLPGFDAVTVEALGRRGEVTHVSLVAAALLRIDPAAFTGILLGGSRPPQQLPENVVVTYGMTETGSGVVYDGVPLDGVEIALAHFEGSNDNGNDEGEILLRAPMLMRAYRDGRTGRVVGPDGTRTWFATGDAGSLTAEGTLSVAGRLAEVITTGGEKVWPDAVERVIATHAGVAEVAVWKRADPEWGERVVAWVVPSGTALPVAALKELVAGTLAPWAAPKEVVLVEALPRTASGKIRRADLR